MDEARALENSPSTEGITGGETGGYYVGSGRSDSDKTKAKGKGFLKKGGPVAIILAAVLGVGIAGFGGQSFQAFSLVNNIMSNYGSSSYSTTVRLTNTIKNAISGKSKAKLSPELEEAGKGADLEFKADADGNIESVTIKSTGETFDSGNIEAGMNGKLGNNVSKAGQNVDIQSTYESKTKTSAAKRISWDKNRYSDYDSGKKADTDSNTKTDFEEIAEGKTKSTSVEAVDIEEDTDEDGNATKITTNEEKTDVDKNNASGNSAGIENIAKKAMKVASSAACAYSAAATAVVAITIAQQVSSMINMSSGYMEATQKVQVGDGDGSSFHEYQNRTNQVDENGKGFWTATSIASIFGGNTGNSSAGVANLENVVTASTKNESIAAELSAIGATATAWKVCIGMRLVSNTVDLIGDIIGIFTVGIGKAVQLAISAAVSVGAGLLSVGIINFLVQTAVNAIGINPVADMATEAAGDYTVGGGNIILSAMGRSMGQSAGTSEKVAKFNKYKEDVIARRAQYDRDNLSPFDTSSQYTFLGSLKYSLVQFSVLNSSNSILGFVKSSSAIVTNSVAKLMPTSSAYEYNSIVSKEGDCPLINSVGGDGNEASGTALHCNYVSISDPSSFGISYEDAVEYLLAHEQLTGSIDSPKVVPNSELAKYITYWTTRDSHLGLADNGIANAEHLLELNSGNSTADTVVNGTIGATPVLGAIADLMNASFDAANYEYIFGAKYVAGGEYWNGNDGGEMMRNIQAFLELDTIYSDLALIETSTLATYLDEYYAENPLDESYEGQLARFSGLSKGQVIAALDYIDYLDEIANYDSTTRYKFFKEEPEQTISLDNNTDYVIAVDTASLEANRATVLYADTRSLYTTSA